MPSGHVLALVIVLGGLRPDMVTSDVMPNLSRFGNIATTYTNARTVFPSVTPVAAASLATGALPRSHGIVSGEVYWPEVASDRLLNLEDHRIARAADQSLNGTLIGCPTFSDVLAAGMRRVEVVGTGPSSAAHLINPRAAQNRHWTFSTAERSATPTPSAWDQTVAKFGFPPERELPRFEEVRYAIDVLIDRITGRDAPDAAVLWLSEPGDSARYRGLGSEVSESVMRHVDKHLGRLLNTIEETQGFERTLVVIASEHGNITSVGEIDITRQLRAAGLIDERSGIASGGPVVTSGGCGALFGFDDECERAAIWLMQQTWVGSVLTRTRNGRAILKGTVPLELAGLDHVRCPAVMFTLASDLGLDENGLPGRGLACGSAGSASATCAGLNQYEMKIVLKVSGPRFRRGFKSDAEAGIIDIAPTLLTALGTKPPPTMLGRDLAEAHATAADSRIVEFHSGDYGQRLLVSALGRGLLGKA
jgi:hypothetical protein